MRVTYDPVADALCVYVSDREVVETHEVAPDVNVDLSAEGALIRIEILAVSRRPGSSPMAIAFEILGRDLTT